ncbi:AraC family transcriptional regulator [Pelomonas sp. KK5]|uniref:AraC family transcriptional regulator n=1 Tax=Pelomonas sp. KK5 TaxID=1855730 RepID=UPI00097CB78E|nr:AraC family transcriptional regulator [Pelomonas sp. KK5]
MSSTFVRGASLTHFAEVAQHFGLDLRRLLADAGLHARVLQEPELQVPADRVSELLERAAQQSSCESFGLRMAELRQLGTMGPVGLLIRDQPTLRDSLNVLMRYQRLLNGAMSLVMEEAAGVVVIREELAVGQARARTRQSIELVTGITLRLLRQFLGADWQPRRVCFTHAAPRDLSTHLRVFGPCVEFDHDFNGIVCARGELDTRNPTADPAMARYAQQLLDAQLSERQQQGRQAPVLDDVRRTALLLLPGGRCTIETVAEHLGLVCRTLQRRLAEEGTSFSDIVTQLRVELAERHVSGSDRPLTEVSALLGFSAPSGFSRWYVGQFGCSPSQGRAAARPRR